MSRLRRYSELIQLSTFTDRFNYCRLDGKVGDQTFGTERYINQRFYRSSEWRSFRRQIILRDNGFDLGFKGVPIPGRIYVHHLNPLTIDDLENPNEDYLFNPEYFICVSFDTHQAIHYGFASPISEKPVERCKWDTCPWRQS